MYSDLLWNDWVIAEMGNYETAPDGRLIYKKKGYLHVDHRYWFPDKQQEIRNLLQQGLVSFNKKNNRNEYYSFSPFAKLLVKTPRYRYQYEEGHYDLETKIRPICYAAHMDSLILGFYSFCLTKVYEDYIKNNCFDEAILAYRTDLGKCNIQFAQEVFQIVKQRGECSAIALDIKGYFDNIDHIILLEKWKKVLGGKLPLDQFKLYNVVTKYSYINQKRLLKKYQGPARRNSRLPATLMDIVPGKNIKEKFMKLNSDQLIVTNNKPKEKTGRCCGIPQGSPISSLLSNIYLIDFDADLIKKGISEGFSYRRYCDDILIICDTDVASKLMKFIIDKICKEYFLTIQPDKVDLIDFHRNSANQMRGFRRPRKTWQKPCHKKKVIIRDSPAKTTSGNEQKLYRPLQYLGFEYNGKDILIRPSSLSRYFWKLNYRLQRTVVMSHSPKSLGNQIFLRQIYERYTHIGTRNFLTYAYKASKKSYKGHSGKIHNGLDSPAIRKQLRNHFNLLRHELSQKNEKWFSHRLKSKKKVTPNHFK